MKSYDWVGNAGAGSFACEEDSKLPPQPFGSPARLYRQRCRPTSDVGKRATYS